jgi:hypothetical protein
MISKTIVLYYIVLKYIILNYIMLYHIIYMVVDQTHLSAHSHSILDPIIIRHHPTPSALESIDASHH